ncbi:hypothetical protein H2203_005204 [Taxawa tesnikishii (nom. ined.)]|nr:hypothetical protein H2203_005204 [Dothideales sp. JES 119]
MDDANIIITLVASKFAEQAFALPCNNTRYLSPVLPPATLSEPGSREGTPFPNAQADNTTHAAHRLHLTFDQPPKCMQKGYVFGTDPRRCDILLGKRRGQGSISGEHFSITFDDDGRVILRDSSRCGTAVSYGGQAKTRSDHTSRGSSSKISRKLKFNFLEPSSSFGSSWLGIKNARQSIEQTVLKESASTLPPFSILDIHSQTTTAAPTTSHSPGQGSLYILYEELGRGEFGTVHKVVDASTGYVPKPNPLLVMEYLPLGNLQDQHENVPIAVEDAVALLYQGLQGVAYLHSQCLAHRDIKPANILIESRSPFSIKLADFGLVKDMSALQTCCGTALYAAPEIWKQSGYTSAVDIWSLGLVVFEFAYGLPKLKRGPFRARDWCNRVVKAVEDWDSDELVDCLSTHMLRLDPKRRSSADDCLKQAAEIHRSYQVMLYMPYQRAECTTPTEMMSTFGVDLYGLDTCEQYTHLDTLVTTLRLPQAPYRDDKGTSLAETAMTESRFRPKNL